MNIHQPTHTPASRRQFDYTVDPRYAYLEWLHMEARLLQIELMPDADPEAKYSPVGTFAHGFHFPIRGTWQNVPKPSTRALAVLEAAGVKIPARARRRAAR